jgi:hypothetical protein
MAHSREKLLGFRDSIDIEGAEFLDETVFTEFDVIDEDITPYTIQEIHEKQPRRLPWMISTLVLGVLCSILMGDKIYHHYRPRPPVLRSDMEDARKAIQYEQKVWTGALTYDETQEQFVMLQDAPVKYVGEPSQAIDDAWSELLRGKLHCNNYN